MTEILEVAGWRQKSAMEISQNQAHHPAQNIIQKKRKQKQQTGTSTRETKEKSYIYKERQQQRTSTKKEATKKSTMGKEKRHIPTADPIQQSD